MRRRLAYPAALLLAGFAPLAARGAEPPASPVAVDYLSDVKAVLKARCYACHGALEQEAGLRLDTVATILKGGQSGPAVKPGDGAGSDLVARVSASDLAVRMPPEGKPLSAAQIAKLIAWVNAGAPSVADEQPDEDPALHWAFQAPQAAPVPAVRNVGWVRNPIDAFVAAEHERRGLAPSAEAAPAILLRRVYLDLTGVPPTREELHEFLDDTAPGAYERVVDKLLASPRYGERWGRHWMDVWRYSDWYGRRAVPDVMNSYPRIWRWRDWIVRSLNEDKGYDRMVVEMLAADEATPDDDNVVATGFVLRNWYKWNYNTWMKDAVEHTSKAFLGLSMNCAHCHDHKYDPIAQEDYFKFRAFFEPLELRHDRVAGEADPGPFKKYVYGASYGPIASGAVRIFDEKFDATTQMYRGGDSRNVIAGKPPIPPGVPAFLGGDKFSVTPVDLPPRAWYPGLKPFVQQEETVKLQAAVCVAENELTAARTAWEQVRPTLEAEVAAAEAAWQAVSQATTPGSIAALSGEQSLVLEAGAGRAVLAHRLAGLPPVDESFVVTCKIQIVRDAHANVQLALDVDRGATGGVLVFDQGAIRSYEPGTFEEFTAGAYDVAKGQRRFDVRFEMQPAQNRAVLTVACLDDRTVLVDHAPVALNGWNPAGREGQGLFVDARTGSTILLDDLAFGNPDRPALKFDFEAPTHAEGSDASGIGGWLASTYTAAPGTAKVKHALPADGPPQAAELALQVARAKRRAAEFALTLAERKLAAAQDELASLQARIAADKVRFGFEAGDAHALALSASQRERQATLAVAELALATAGKQLAEAAARQPADAERPKAIATATQALATSQAAVDAARVALAAESDKYSPLGPVYPQKSTGRRLALARWMTSRDNPLTARVAVNHIWLRHFGAALAPSTADFGRNGKRPINQPLLDWLAVELMNGQWSMKALHRSIMTSSAYRQRSQGGRGGLNAAADPDNRYLWRFNPGRMEAEAVRDSLLHLAGALDPAIGGEEIDHVQGLTSTRRSLYFAHHGEGKMEFLDLFDGANACDCYQRTTSVMPQQALALANNELTLRLSRQLAARLWQQAASEVAAGESPAAPAFVTGAFEQVLGRSPTAAETAAGLSFLEKQTATLAPEAPAASTAAVAGASPSEGTAPGSPGPAPDPAARARESLIHALFNHNDFVTIR